MSEVRFNSDQSAALRAAVPGTKFVADDGNVVGFFLPLWMAEDFFNHLKARGGVSDAEASDTPHVVVEKRPDLD